MGHAGRCHCGRFLYLYKRSVFTWAPHAVSIASLVPNPKFYVNRLAEPEKHPVRLRRAHHSVAPSAAGRRRWLAPSCSLLDPQTNMGKEGAGCGAKTKTVPAWNRTRVRSVDLDLIRRPLRISCDTLTSRSLQTFRNPKTLEHAAAGACAALVVQGRKVCRLDLPYRSWTIVLWGVRRAVSGTNLSRFSLSFARLSPTINQGEHTA